MTRIRDLHNLGVMMEERLSEVGISCAEDLARIGIIEAFQRLRSAFGAEITWNALYAMDAALEGVDWRSLPKERKAALREAAGAGAPLGTEVE
jgi:hypothetical protein